MNDSSKEIRAPEAVYRLQVSCETNPEDAEPSCFVRFSSWTLPAAQLRLTARKGRVNAG